MKGNLYHDTPPSYVTPSQLARSLGMSRQLFYQSGLAAALDRWQVGRVTLYRREDATDLARWLVVRRGLVALGVVTQGMPLNPEEDEFNAAVYEGYWDEPCPRCEAVGVADPLRSDRIWCPVCGLTETSG